MSGFPIAWEDGFSDQAIPVSQCPYAVGEIEEYLRVNHYHWALEQPPLGYRVDELILRKQEVGRNYWVFRAVDDLERAWFVIVGSGKSPFDPVEKMWRWMYAVSNESNQPAEAFFEHEYAEQLLHDLHEDR